MVDKHFQTDTQATVETKDSSKLSCCCHQEAPLYLTKSTHGDGWGVFSRYPLREGQFVELAPLLLRFHEDDPSTEKVLKDTVLNNYHYEYGPSHFVLSFGHMLYFNHSSACPNIKYCQLGSQPDVDSLDDAVGLGYYALCNIDAHVELLCDYGGSEWFRDRGLDLVEDTNDETSGALVDSNSPQVISSRIDNDTVLCSKLYGGYTEKCIHRVVDCHTVDFECSPYNLKSLYSMGNFFMAEDPTGFGNVVCRQDVNEGETLEVAPVLLLPKTSVEGSILETIVINWEDLECSKEIAGLDVTSVMTCQEDKDDRSIAKVSLSSKHVKLEETVMLALAGNLSLMAREPTNYNARFVVEQDPFNSYGFVLRLFATKSIRQGERITVKLPSLSRASRERFAEELALTGQPITSYLLAE